MTHLIAARGTVTRAASVRVRATALLILIAAPFSLPWAVSCSKRPNDEPGYWLLRTYPDGGVDLLEKGLQRFLANAIGPLLEIGAQVVRERYAFEHSSEE